MARSVRRARAYRDRLVTLLAGAPNRPTQLSWRAWFGVFRRTVAEFIADDLNDRAAIADLLRDHVDLPGAAGAGRRRWGCSAPT